jgi:hypothetical protein
MSTLFEASVSTIVSTSGSSYHRIGADIKASLSRTKASLYSSVHLERVPFLMSMFSSLVICL